MDFTFYLYNNLYFLDEVAYVVFFVLICLIGLLGYVYISDRKVFLNIETIFVLVFSLCSAIIVMVSTNLVYLYLALEAFTVSTLILFLINFDLKVKLINACLKYLVVSALSSVVIVLSITIIYGLFGVVSFKLVESLSLFVVQDCSNFLVDWGIILAVILLFIAFAIKLAIVLFNI